MSRRVNLPGADELFRATATEDQKQDSSPAPGKAKHDEKMTIYLTSEELLAVEQARLQLKSLTGRKVDRSRLVRAAIAGALADLESRGADSEVATRLQES
ncbi:MAG TPA: hypothetical protein PLQ19_01830 [Aeromicrobium sp.]|nr:hypothetical protein [Aeromicrobium sp.]